MDFPFFKPAMELMTGGHCADIVYSIPKINVSQKTIKNYWGYDISWLEIDFSSYDIPDIPHFPNNMVLAHINYSSMYPKKLQISSEKVFRFLRPQKTSPNTVSVSVFGALGYC